ncbi:MAG: VOC family protein [Caldilineaceae bacterium]|nr:VOC family protein [Caldilineaceae bacterium]
MNLGTFSVSLAVADLPASRAFYEKLGFEAIDGQPDEGWIILRNGDTHIGLFQKMFEKNILTFNPTDVRAIQAQLKAQGIQLIEEAAPGDGPTHITLLDPDGNPILIDQHPADYEPTPPQ